LIAARSATDQRLAETAVLVVAVLWAANFVVVKAANTQIPPVAFAFVRFGIAGLTLLLLLRWREGDIRLPLRDAVPIAILGGLGYGVYQILWASALQTIPAGDSALIIATTPVLTALLAVAAGSDVLTPVKLAGALVSFLGVALVIGAGQELSIGTSLGGSLVTLVAALLWAVYTAYGAPFLVRHSPLKTTAWSIVFGSLVLLVPGTAQFADVDVAQVDGAVWLGLAYSAFLPAGLANVVVFHAVKLLGPTRITNFQSLVPAFAVVIAAVVLAEPLRVEQLVGGVVIVAGVLLTRRATLVPSAVRARFRP
jgi:drug/metabolite transporter (DMT)-like permease